LRGYGLDEDRYDRQRRIWGKTGQKALFQAKILIAGAGGVGSEIIKNLALLGIGSLIIVDMDLIELSNLNRQLLFHDSDVGKYKAEIAASKARELNPGIQVQFYTEKLQNLSNEVYEDVDLYISALDNIPARVFLNQKAVLFKKPLIDGGSEGFFGHVQVVIPRVTPCLLCHDIWSRLEEKFKCSYAVNPRTPLDCVLEGRDKFYLQFNRLPNQEDEGDLKKVYEYALDHAQKYNIIGVNYDLVKDSIKGTVAALVTTNAIIGAVMTNELLKLILKDIPINGEKLSPLTYYQFNGLTESGWSVPLERNEQCPVCSIKQIEIKVPASSPLIQFIRQIDTYLTFELQAPLLLKEGVILYRDASLFEGKAISQSEQSRIKENELKAVKEFFKNGDSLFLKDEILGIELRIKIILHQDEGGLA
jgi:ubiquitin-activating enzyme E1 C